MPGQKTKISKTMYVFHSSGNTSRTGDCVISAHGSRAIHPRSFVVPTGVTIYFYVPAGFSGISVKNKANKDAPTLDGASMSVALNETLLNPVKAQQTVTAGQECPNYNLGKILTGEGTVPYREADLISFFNNYPQARDILTIRHRREYQDMDLATVVRVTKGSGCAYHSFHCVFCRVPALFPSRGDFSIASGFTGTFSFQKSSPGFSEILLERVDSLSFGRNSRLDDEI